MMRRVTVLTVATLVIAALAVVPGIANEGASVYVSKGHDDVWSFSFDHYNPCTETVETVSWEAEHRSQAVDKDGDWATEGDKHKHGGVMELLSVDYSAPNWEVGWVGDKFAQNGWDEVEWFGHDDQAAVIYKVTLRATNTLTGESFQTRHDLRWVSNANGEVIHGQ